MNKTLTERALPEAETERCLRFLGLCRRAGKTVHGTPLVCTALAAKRRLISAYLTAFGASVNDNEAFFGIRLSPHGLKLTSAGIGSVSGIYIHVQ